MPYPFDATDTAAIGRLGQYNGGAYNATTNPRGLGVGGHIVNVPMLTADAARAANAISDAAGAAASSASTAVATLTGTSTTSLAVGTGSKTWTTQAGKTFAVGTYVTAIASGGAVVMTGQVTDYSGTSLTVNVQRAIGSGTYNSWSISVSGPSGGVGETGLTGPANTLTVGTVTNLAPGSQPTVAITGTAPNQVANFGIVRGADGNGGAADQTYQALLRQMEFEAALARLTTPITELPSVNLDFLFDTYFMRRAAIAASLTVFLAAVGGSFTRSSAAWHFDAAGTLVQAAANVPRLDHDPITLARLGYLVEAARTNGIRNNTMQGAVAGSPGTRPNYWTIAPVDNIGSLVASILGIGTENGIDYIDVRLSGTSSGNGYLNITFGDALDAAATTGQKWTHSAFIYQSGGTQTNISEASIGISEYTNTSSFINNGTAPVILSGGGFGGNRKSYTKTLSGGDTAGIQPFFTMSYAGGAIDITLRIGLPQLELGVYASSPIKTAGSAVTRAADRLWLPWVNTGSITMLTCSVIRRTATQPAFAADLGDGTYNNRILSWVDSSNISTASITLAGTPQLLTSGGSLAAGTVRSIAHAIAAGDQAMSVNGGAVVTGALPDTLPAVSRLHIGYQGAGGGYFDGHIQRLTIFPGRLTNAKTQSLSGATL